MFQNNQNVVPDHVLHDVLILRSTQTAWFCRTPHTPVLSSQDV